MEEPIITQQHSPTCWRCHSCTFVNDVESDFCAICTTKQPQNPASVKANGSFADMVDIDSPKLHHQYHSSSNADVNNINIRIAADDDDDGSWVCAMCTFKNAQQRSDCEMCLRSRWNDRRLFTELLAQLNEYGGIVFSTTDGDCPICLDRFAAGDAMVLSDCLHVFCFECLAQTIRYSPDALVRCPFVCSSPDGSPTTTACEGNISDSEIRALLVKPGEYDFHMALSIKLAEAREADSFHCKTPDCPGWCINERGNEESDFPCPVCLVVNCLRCDDNHEGLSCIENNDHKTKDRENSMLSNMLAQGVVMRCPQCKNLVQKNGGCDTLTCKVCRHVFSWATRTVQI